MVQPSPKKSVKLNGGLSTPSRPNSTMARGNLKRPGDQSNSNAGNKRRKPMCRECCADTFTGNQVLMHPGIKDELKSFTLGKLTDIVQSIEQFFHFVPRDRPLLLESFPSKKQPTIDDYTLHQPTDFNSYSESGESSDEEIEGDDEMTEEQ